ncbi:uncharacterized protein STEHIDRAFT_120110 [Stereum hirsutum FP-91666 SS1]|uniref:uncharacterized protein n=1 Tax=Stereum hirsutum (strain FP-91666) TaxID=721885 RepID=UPI000440FD35|nr:uncharacterized protein STEHIDRAFT_120110 [Stereum hirsutum FP-91666 SS1]EIM87837.1 hypothetical protein STEHIDRAFT_120110 [Stereum hirsutum FP-91666 SS1]
MAQSEHSVTVLGKRKTRDSLVLHLSATSDTASDSEYAPSASPVLDTGKPIAGPSRTRVPNLVNGNFVPPGTERRYQCTFDGCGKAYSKPSRLEEHERSHTGQRPFVCSTCHKSYLRDSHLQAHARSHQPQSERPIACPESGCNKRFWTSQHLKNHANVIHKGEKPWKCTELRCDAAFVKHGQLRAHLAEIHAPPGTQPHQCEYEGCTKSFPTNQKLRAHSKVHDDKRYTCVQGTCLASRTPTYYPTWSALQHHIRTAHAPTCPHATCNGKTFTTQSGLRGHLKLHEEREMEGAVDAVATRKSDAEEDGEGDGDDERPTKRRRGGEVGRDWKCEEEGCIKDFKSKKALKTHHAITHLGRRDFVCERDGCGETFGYKHLLQRHSARVHGEVEHDGDGEVDMDGDADAEGDAPNLQPRPRRTANKKGRKKGMKRTEIEAGSKGNVGLGIDTITGLAYANAAASSSRSLPPPTTNAQSGTAPSTVTRDTTPLRPLLLPCPHPDLTPFNIHITETPETVTAKRAAQIAVGEIECEYVFGRAYDLRRHLSAVHGVVVEKDVLDAWALEVRKGRWVRARGGGGQKEKG